MFFILTFMDNRLCLELSLVSVFGVDGETQLHVPD